MNCCSAFRPRRCLCLLAALLFVSGPAVSGKDASPKKREAAKADSRSEVWMQLEPDQRSKLREALREAWTDPAVINAREEVKQAGEAYQAAIKAAVERIDPSLVALLQKVQAAEGPWPGRETDASDSKKPKGRGVGGGKGFGDQIKPPGFLESLSPEAREKFQKAEETALESEAVKAARAELAKIREEDEALRRKRLEAHRKLRRVTLDEMVRADPSIADLPKRLGGGSPERRKGGGEKAKGGKAKGGKGGTAEAPEADSDGRGAAGDRGPGAP